jgi:hypothetical protein
MKWRVSTAVAGLAPTAALLGAGAAPPGQPFNGPGHSGRSPRIG